MLNERERNLIDKLPAAARERFVKLFSEAEVLANGARATAERRRDLCESLQSDKDILAEILALPPYGVGDARVEIAKQHIASKSRELLDIDAVAHDQDEHRRTQMVIVKRTFEFLAKLNGSLPQPLNQSPAVPHKGESVVAAIDRVRAQVGEHKAELELVQMAPWPAALVKERAEREIDALAKRGAPDVVATIYHGEKLRWPETTLFIGGEAGRHVGTVDTLALLAFLHKDALVAAVCREIDAAADDAAALSPGARASAVKKIEAQLVDAERDEVSYIAQAERAGISIAHRQDVSILALLGLSDKLAPAAAIDPTPQMHGNPRRRRAIEATV